MTTRIATRIAALIVIAMLALPGQVNAHQQRSAQYPYILIDVGTFGGPNSGLDLPGQTTNARGAVVGTADTPTADPHAPKCFSPDCFVSLGFVWQHGILTKLDSLPGGSGNEPYSITANRLIAGGSSNGTVDPLTGFEEARAVIWQNGTIRGLGTLPGGNESIAFVMNDQGMVAGPATNGTPDPYSCDFFICWGSQTRTFLWQNGVMRDLGTLGGPDSLPLFMNNRGQIAGVSYTSATPNAATGQPTLDPFLWENGHMRDLGSLGGTLGFTNAMNSRGEVVGQSSLAGDQIFHPFLWDGRSLRDLGTLGGNNGGASWVNEAGEVAGSADLPGSQVHHGFLWRHGVMTDLGTVNGDPCSIVDAMNDRGQVVGSSTSCQARLSGFLWEHGAMADLNTLVAPSALHVNAAYAITDMGEIVGEGVLPNGNQHVVVLIPREAADRDGVMSNAPEPGTGGPAAAPREGAVPCAADASAHTRLAAWRAWLTHRYHLWTC